MTGTDELEIIEDRRTHARKESTMQQMTEKPREFTIKENPLTKRYDVIELWEHGLTRPGYPTHEAALTAELAVAFAERWYITLV